MRVPGDKAMLCPEPRAGAGFQTDMALRDLSERSESRDFRNLFEVTIFVKEFSVSPNGNRGDKAVIEAADALADLPCGDEDGSGSSVVDRRLDW